MLKMTVLAPTFLSLPVVAAPTAIEGRAQIIDGDTIAIEGFETRIRLDSIDAPESTQPCYDATGKVQSFAPMMLAAGGAKSTETPGENDYTAPDPNAADDKPLPTTSATSCKSARTCRDAVILWCGGYSRADNDGDGIPCENVCSSRKQVDAIKKQIGCTD